MALLKKECVQNMWMLWKRSVSSWGSLLNMDYVRITFKYLFGQNLELYLVCWHFLVQGLFYYNSIATWLLLLHPKKNPLRPKNSPLFVFFQKLIFSKNSLMFISAGSFSISRDRVTAGTGSNLRVMDLQS